jgi:integrase/recombinase XerD
MASVNELEALVEAWIIAQESPHTQRAYRRDLLSDVDRQKVPGWIPWCAQRDLDPLSVRRRDVDTYKQTLKAAAYSPTTVARRLSSISSWYDYLLDEDVTEDNPAKSVKRPRIDQSVSNAVGLTEGELNALFDTATEDGPRSLALVSILFFGGGLRVGSACSANVGDLGWSDGKRTIRLTVKGGEVIRENLDEMAADSLDVYLATRGATKKSDPLFTTGLGNRVDPAFVAREVRRLARLAHVPSWEAISPHSLRHTFATLALDAGASLVDLQDQMRHRSLDTTRRYDRARGKRDRLPSRLLADRRRRYLAERTSPPSTEEVGSHDDSA